MKNFAFMFIFLYFGAAEARDVPLGVFPGGSSAGISAAPASGTSSSTGKNYFTLRIHNSCYGTNLRNAGNPISPDSIIKGTFKLNFGGKDIEFWVKFPGQMTSIKGVVGTGLIYSMSEKGNGTVTAMVPHEVPATPGGLVCTGGVIGRGLNFTAAGMQIYCNQYRTTAVCLRSCRPTNPSCPPGYTLLTTPANTCSGFISQTTPGFAFENYASPVIKSTMFGNTLFVDINKNTKESMRANGDPASNHPAPRIVSSTFTQEVSCDNRGPVYGSYGSWGYSSYIPTYACGAFMAKNGDVQATTRDFTVSADSTSADINVSFPGQTGFCGGYWSPLMVFFDEQRPKFDNISSFPLNPGSRTAWVEANAPGYFLVIDQEGKGNITSANQLFGNSEQNSNGFEKLKKLDSNKDGWIDRKDAEFKKLYLWNDKNGDGVSAQDELHPLGKMVSKVSLKYNNNILHPIGKYAEERERSTIVVSPTYAKELKKIQGQKRSEASSSEEPLISDIWLAPRP